MQTFEGRVAVVTGAASGIGRAMAGRFARAGMKVVLADVEQDALATAEAELRATGATVRAVPTDVSDGAAVEALARETLSAFGAVHLVCNNAGVYPGPARSWEYTPDDWAWVLEVNLWGVIHGVRVFVPIMLAQQTDGHVVNAASILGLFTNGGGPYIATKYAVVGLSEGLAKELAQEGSRVKVSVLCPGYVRTDILEAARNRPTHRGAAREQAPDAAAAARALFAAGTPAEEIAEQIFEAVREERFYVLPHPGFKALIQERMEEILQDRYPRPIVPQELVAAWRDQ